LRCAPRTRGAQRNEQLSPDSLAHHPARFAATAAPEEFLQNHLLALRRARSPRAARSVMVRVTSAHPVVQAVPITSVNAENAVVIGT